MFLLIDRSTYIYVQLLIPASYRYRLHKLHPDSRISFLCIRPVHACLYIRSVYIYYVEKLLQLSLLITIYIYIAIQF